MAEPAGTYPEDLHGIAAEAEKCLEKLATGLSEAGAAPDAVKTVSDMADVVHQVVKALGEGQEQTGDDEPPAAPPPGGGGFDEAAAGTAQDTQAAAASRGPA
jgi:hypothetical protein